MEKIEVNNLCFGYIKAPLCIKDLCLELKRGEVLHVIGGEGMGKTSLLKIFAGLENQYAGFIKFDKVDLTNIPIKDRGISYLPSEPVFFDSKTVEYNLKYLYEIENLGDFNKENIEKILLKFDAKFTLGDRVKNLNLYEKRLLAIIRSYIKNAKIILIDDQFLNLSFESVNLIKNAISLLLSENINDKHVIIVNNCENIENVNNKYLYISYGKNFYFNSLDELKNNPVDLFSYDYFLSISKDLMLEKSNESYYLIDYKIEYENEKKKKGEKQVVLSKKKLSDSLKETFDLIKLNNEEAIKVKIFSFGKIDYDKLEDSNLNQLILSGEIHIFEEGTGVKII